MPYRIAVDTGGTFTDVVVASPGGALAVGKAPSTPARSADGSEDPAPNGVMLALAPGEFVRSVDNGGSGYGDPLTREPAHVLEDVVEGYVTRDHAESVYGVVIAGSADDGTLAVDEAATRALRAARSAA